jgi:hypothetical protein
MDLNLDGIPVVAADDVRLVPVVAVRQNVYPVKGKGLAVHGGKTATALRIVPLPELVTTRLLARRHGDENPEWPVVFAVAHQPLHAAYLGAANAGLLAGPTLHRVLTRWPDVPELGADPLEEKRGTSDALIDSFTDQLIDYLAEHALPGSIATVNPLARAAGKGG